MSAGVISMQAQKNGFTIEGVIKDMPNSPEKVYLSYKTEQYNFLDSARVKNGRYSFSGSFDGIRDMFVSTMNLDSRLGIHGLMSLRDMAEFYLDKGKIRIVSTGTMQNAVVTGSMVNDEYLSANKRYDLLMDSLKQMVKMGQDEMNDVASTLVWAYGERVTKVVATDYPLYIGNHRDAAINPILIQKLMTSSTAAGWIDRMDSLYKLMPPDLQASMEGKSLGEKLALELQTAIGHKAMDFTQQDMEGHSVRLSSFKGKYVLLDFWASTDPNCYHALPVLVKAHETYGSKGLVVLGVSLDDDRAAWMKAIEETNSDQISQVSDLKGMENAAAKMYGITSVPKNFLIDPNGVIIAKNLTSLTLDKTLTSIFE
jgi:peroxiredoxin